MSNQTPDDTPRPFAGFRSPNFTMVPDELFDVLLPELSGAELKVLLYIVRRTFGFKRDSDTISINQMLHGIKTRDGRVLDRGVGLTKKTLLAAIRSLEERNAILTQQRRSLERGNEPTSYQLNVIEPTLGVKITPPLGEKLPQGVGVEITPSPRGKNYPTQYTVEQETVKQDTDLSNIRKGTPSENQEDGSYPQRPSGTPTSSRSRVGSAESVGEVLNRQGARPRASTPRPETETEEWQAIQAYIIDFARQLGDRAPTKSSTSRAYNLYKASGLSVGDFISRMYQARALTQESTAKIKAKGTDATAGTPRKIKMGYFFAVLEDQLGLIDEEERDKRTSRPRTRSQKKEKGNDDPYAHLIQR